ncbi:class B sortase [Hungatella hathewayi]|uniref:class B sortase n=1 Tax=Hungatella hathewayi TaxID=154046 RepID=UPI00356A74DD
MKNATLYKYLKTYGGYGKMRIPFITLAAFGIAVGCFIFVNNVNAAKEKEEFEFSVLAVENFKSANKQAQSTVVGIGNKDKVETRLLNTMNKETTEYESHYNFNELHVVNEDVVAWVNIPGTEIDYPIVFDGTDDYLHLNLSKEYSYSGTPFIDKLAKNPLKDTVNIIYGHHMKNGTLFSDIDKYNDASYFEEHKEINVYTEHEELNLHPVVTITGKADAAIRTIQSTDDLSAFAQGKDITVGTLPEEINELYVFVTCNYSGNDFRTYLICTK